MVVPYMVKSGGREGALSVSVMPPAAAEDMAAEVEELPMTILLAFASRETWVPSMFIAGAPGISVSPLMV